MWKVTVSNLLSNIVFNQVFESQELAQAWIDSCVEKNVWGKPARQVTSLEVGEEILVLSQEEILIDAEMPELGTQTLYNLKADYEVDGPTEILASGNSPEARDLRLQEKLAQADLWEKYYLYGDKVKKYFTYLINTRPITSEQKNSIQAMPEIIAIDVQLKFGRLLQAKALAQALVADEALIFQEDVDKVCEFIDDLIANA